MMDKITVGIDATPLVRVSGGIGFYTKILLETLLQSEKDAVFYLFSPFDSEELKYWRNFPNVKVVSCSRFSFSEALWSQTTLVWLLQQSPVTVFWGVTQSIPLLRPLRVRTVLTVHDFVFKLFPKTMSPVRRNFLRFFSRAMYKSADRIVCVSHGTKRKARDIFGISAHEVVSPPLKHVNFVRKNEGFKVGNAFLAPEKYFLFVGALEPRKNLIGALRAFDQVLNDEQFDDDVKMVVVGAKGWRNDNIKDQITSFQAKHPARLVVMDFVDEGSYSALLSNCKFLFMPSHYEGYGMPVAEAYAYGRPTLATDIEEHREAGRGLGDYCSPADIKKALLAALEMPLPARNPLSPAEVDAYNCGQAKKIFDELVAACDGR